jgi:pimeloyl-ACP methyl ester carboxylesterase
LIHGLDSDAESLAGLAAAFRAHDIQVAFFDYPNDGPIAWSGERLSREMSELHTSHPEFRSVIVAHSMGGLVARYALETPGKNPGGVTDLVTLGTPHAGSNLAGGQVWAELAFEGVPRRANDLKTIRDGLGEAGRDLKPGSPFLRELNAHPRSPGVRYHCAVGTKGFLSDELYQKLAPNLEEYLAKREIPGPIRSWLVDVIRNSPEIRTGHGDGLVSIASATLEDAITTRQFACNHRQLIKVDSAEPDSDVVRWILETLGW